MKKILLVLALASFTAYAQEPGPARNALRAQLAEAESQLELVKRLIPPDFSLDAERTAIDALATKAEMAPVRVEVLTLRERVMLEGKATPLEIARIAISGTDRYDRLHFFLSMLRLRPHPAGLESLQLDAAAGESVRYEARLDYPFWSPQPAEEAPRPGTRPDELTLLRERLAAIRTARDAAVDALARLKDARLADALAELSEDIDGHPIALRSVRIDASRMLIEGLTLGTSARDALQTGLEAAALQTENVTWSLSGPCRAFVVRAAARSKTGGDSLDDIIGDTGGFTPARPVFDGESIAFCNVTQTPPQRIVAGSAPARGDPAFFLRLREVEWRDLFFVLNDLLGESYVVDGDLTGTVDFDVFESASVEQLFRAIESHGLTIGPGPLRRVARGRMAIEAKPSAPDGEPVTFSFRAIHLSDVLCLLGRITGQEVRMAPDAQRRLSLFGTEMPAVVVLEQLLPRPGGTSMNACDVPTPPTPRLATRRSPAAPLAIDDIRIAGLAQVGDAWRAYAAVPSGGLLILEPEQPLRDGSVQSIDSRGVVFAKGAEVLRRNLD